MIYAAIAVRTHRPALRLASKKSTQVREIISVTSGACNADCLRLLT